MMRVMGVKKSNRVLLPILIAGLSLSMGAVGVSAQQNQENDTSPRAEQPDQRPPIQGVYRQPTQQSQLPQYQPGDNAPPQNQAPPPSALTLPAGTVVRVRVDQWLSSDRNIIGDTFDATLDQPIVVDGWVVARRGQSETGRVSLVKKAGHGNDTSQLGLQLNELTLVDGQQLPLQTQLFQISAGNSSSPGRDVAVVGTTAGVGAIIGGAVNGGLGAGFGAGAGAIAGMIGLASTKGKSTVISPETVLSFRLQAPVTISTDRSQYAFQPVTQDDYDSRPGPGPQRSAEQGGPAPAYPLYYAYPYPYVYPYAYGYYPFGFGYYGGYGFRGRFGGFRGGFRR